MEGGMRDYISEDVIGRLSPSKWSLSTSTLLLIFLSLALFTSVHWGFPGAASFLQLKLSWNGIGGSRMRSSSEPRSQKNDTAAGSGGSECPEYFRWIHEDLRPWKGRGISRKLVEDGRSGAYFRLVIVKGEVYVDKYKAAYQTRDVFNIWGILQLLRLYPGKLPDLDLMFSCDDWPAIKRSGHDWSKAAAAPPPVFGYCGDDQSVVVRFPDWSFWGWPEIHIEPWEALKKKLEAGNKEVNWTAREPHAYWKGNTGTGTARRQLCRCNVTDQKDWNARIYHLDWAASFKEGFSDTNLANQCTHRYKIYVEGNTWSVSEKYILACDSMTLLVAPRFHDFYTRSLRPLTHYWPINAKNECRSLKFAVDWGNAHPQQAQKIGKAGAEYIMEELKMKNVYDYMFHLLSEYAKLLSYRPTVPEGAVRVCTGDLDCVEKEKNTTEGHYKIGSMVQGPSKTEPCKMLPPYDRPALTAFLGSKEKLVRQVQSREERGNFHEDVDG